MDCEEMLKQRFRERKYEIRVMGKSFFYTLPETGVIYDTQSILNEAYRVGRRGFFNSIRDIFLCLGRGVRIELKAEVDKDKWKRFLKKVEKRVAREPVNAKIVWEGGSWSISPSREGYKVDEKKALEEIEKGWDMAEPLNIPVEIIPPRIKEEDLRGMEVLATFATRFNLGDVSRTSNIKRAVRAIDGTLLRPGEVFSFNAVVGPRVSERGYKVAPVMVEGQLIPGVGGGVCQVSTTLYNAVLLAGLEVVRRSHHARPVKYISPGRDATVVWRYVDLKFRNNKESPIYIQGEVTGNRVRFRVFGRKDFEDIRIETKVNYGVDGTVVAEVYRVIYKNDDEVIREKISRDIYKPLSKIIKTTPPR